MPAASAAFASVEPSPVAVGRPTELAHGEDDGYRQRPARPGQDALGHGHGGRDGDRVIADPRAAQPAIALRDAPHGGRIEDVIDVHEHGQAVRRRTERPDQVADVVDRTAPGCVLRAPLQPLDAHLLVAGAAVQLGQRHGVGGDRPDLESRGVESHGSAYHLIRLLV
jgi:hypothetical protein